MSITKEYVKEKIEEIRKLDGQRVNSTIDKRERNCYARDYARVLYSSSFRRLQGKMQLLGINHLDFFRNRLTHSLEVAQIARQIATNVGIDNTYVVETCSLAHDLGNPPFGHAGEIVLNDLAISNDIDGFEGNAQTLRILTTLEKKNHRYRGLNLTYRTLLGTVKYFNPFQIENSEKKLRYKKFLYNKDYEMIERILNSNNIPTKNYKSIDAQIMDLADEIAYGAHDLEDCLSNGSFTIDELLYEFKTSRKYSDAYDTIFKIVNNCREEAYKANMLKSSEEYSFIFKKELTSNIVDKLVNDISYVEEKNELSFGKYRKLTKGLKKLVFKLVLKKSNVQFYEKKGERILRGLYEVYSDSTINNKLKLLPPEYRLYDNENDKKRNIIDFISGMMDEFAIEEYKKYYGKSSYDKLLSIKK